MWRVYSAWMEGAVDSDIEAIKSAMELESGAIAPQLGGAPDTKRHLAIDLSLERTGISASLRFSWEIFNGKGGTRTLDPGIMSRPIGLD
jgi:hypothetical protein